MEASGANLNELTAKVLGDSDIFPEEIPNIDLYMDQIITLFESKISGNRRKPEDKLLTKTMVNNYSKEGLLKEIKGKKYTKEHIIQILLIYNLKQTLSIQDIKSVLSSVSGEERITELYRRYLEVKEIQRRNIPSLLGTLTSGDQFDLDEMDKTLLVAMSLTSMANYMKRLAEEIIDNNL